MLHDDPEGPHEVHVALSGHAREVAQAEVGHLAIPNRFPVHGDQSMQVPYVSGSAHFNAMVIIPCSMGTIGRIAHGYSDSAIIRAADVFLKEKRKLILVPRETPWNLPSFYHRPQTVLEVVDTVVARVLDHLGVRHALTKRWMEPESGKD
jgi:4-hydroxy-3-polyprenylbenzoate decarboxylase